MSPEEVSNLVDALRDGDENAYHALIESPAGIVPILIEHFAIADELNGTHRAGARPRPKQKAWPRSGVFEKAVQLDPRGFMKSQLFDVAR